MPLSFGKKIFLSSLSLCLSLYRFFRTTLTLTFSWPIFGKSHSSTLKYSVKVKNKPGNHLICTLHFYSERNRDGQKSDDSFKTTQIIPCIARTRTPVFLCLVYGSFMFNKESGSELVYDQTTYDSADKIYKSVPASHDMCFFKLRLSYCSSHEPPTSWMRSSSPDSNISIKDLSFWNGNIDHTLEGEHVPGRKWILFLVQKMS